MFFARFCGVQKMRTEEEVTKATSPPSVDSAVAVKAESAEKEDVVTPWEVSSASGGRINYLKLIDEFGCQLITDKLIDRIAGCIGGGVSGIRDFPVHRFIRRRLFFAHRELDRICELKEKGVPFFLYTGRGPSSESLHLGHLIPFMFNQWLQEAFDVPIVIQMTDDEKFLFKDGLTLAEAHRLAYENAKDIIACGFDPHKTFIFSNLDYINQLYPTALEIAKRTSFNQTKGIFGFNDSTSIGKVFFPAVEAAPCFAAAFPGMFGTNPNILSRIHCLIPCAIDQDPYFRMARDVAPRLGCPKPAQLYSKFIPALQGFQTKMSGSSPATSIYVTDSPKQISTKIKKYAFSGGQDTIEAHRAKGANLEVDVSYEYLTYFLEDDDELDRIAREYSSGAMLTGEIKNILIKLLQEITQNHQKRRAEVTDSILKEYMNPNKPHLVAHFESRIAAATGPELSATTQKVQKSSKAPLKPAAADNNK